jgi:SagB-type dehydrogenase family enzyme
MAHIDLPSPIPRDTPVAYTDFSYPITGREYLAIPESPNESSFWEVLSSRSSRRAVGSIGETQLAHLLWYSAKTRAARRERDGFLWQSRPAPSAGGRHPVDLIVMHEECGRAIVRLYDPIAHSLCSLSVDQQRAMSFCQHAKAIIRAEDGVLLWFVAQFGRTLGRYVDGESLVWRDAGALLATIYLVCEALELACCAIGPSGDPDVPQIIGAENKLNGVGGCIVGSRGHQPWQLTQVNI